MIPCCHRCRTTCRTTRRPPGSCAWSRTNSPWWAVKMLKLQMKFGLRDCRCSWGLRRAESGCPTWRRGHVLMGSPLLWCMKVIFNPSLGSGEQTASCFSDFSSNKKGWCWIVLLNQPLQQNLYNRTNWQLFMLVFQEKRCHIYVTLRFSKHMTTNSLVCLPVIN